MLANRPPPDTAEAWLEHARSDLKIAQASIPDAYLEDLCYHAQQCSEKALKALLVLRQVKFPYTHDLSELLTILGNSGLIIPEDLKAVAELTPYAVESRYPGFDEPVIETEYKQAIESAQKLFHWAEARIKQFRIEQQLQLQQQADKKDVKVESTSSLPGVNDSKPNPT